VDCGAYPYVGQAMVIINGLAGRGRATGRREQASMAVSRNYMAGQTGEALGDARRMAGAFWGRSFSARVRMGCGRWGGGWQVAAAGEKVPQVACCAESSRREALP